MRITTKLSLGTGFLFVVILIFGVLSLVSLSRLKSDSGQILQNNYETLVYNNQMLEYLNKISTDSSYHRLFESTLQKQEANITEQGERDATSLLRKHFDQLAVNLGNDSLKGLIRQQLHDINDINLNAIFSKNQTARYTAQTAYYWLMIIFTVLVLITFTMAVNFPGIISKPILSLNEGIGAIVNKDYRKRIHLQQNDEFGELAKAFNTMAEKLHEYEHSNLAKLTFEKSRIETIINQMKDGIIGLDEKRNVLFLNAVAEKLMALKEPDIVGQYAPDIALTNDLMRTLLLDQSKGTELKIFADNKESYFLIEVLVVSTDHKTVGEVIILRNITPFHELSEAKTNFIATVSHELKTPLASIKISTQLLADHRIGSLNAEQSGLVKSIEDDADRLLRITSELLNLSQVETGNIQLHIEPVACGDIIEQAVQSVQFLLQQKSIRLTQHLDRSLPPVVADKEKTSWVLINFLTNAIRYSPLQSEILLNVALADARISFIVTDHGKGIPGNHISRIFDRYYQIPGQSLSGTGLGLSIAKEFIEAQGGQVWVESEPNVGSSFGFRLPAAK